MTHNDPEKKWKTFRRVKEERLRTDIDPSELSVHDKDYLIRELQAQRIELEMQNEELRKAQLELQSSLRKYSELYDSAPGGLLMFDADGVVREVNLTGARLLGCERNFLLGKPLSPFVDPNDLGLFREHCRKAVRSDTPVNCELGLLRKDGSRFFADIKSVRAICAETGGECCRSEISDITGRKALEAGLRTSEEEFRSMFELSAVGKGQVDPATRRFIRVNKKFCAITGYSEDELKTMTVADITHPDDAARDFELYQRALRREAPGWKSEKRYIRKDGSVIWAKVTGAFIFNAGGVPVRSIAVVEDITEGRNAEQSLRESEERYRSLVESSPEAICVHQDGLCVYMNPAAIELLAAPGIESVRGRTFIDFIHPDFRGAVEAWVHALGDGRAKGSELELKVLRMNGQAVDVEAVATRIAFKGRPAVQLMFSNVTEGRRRELRLRLQATILSQVSDAVVAVGRDGCIIFWNQGAERLYGLPAEKAIGRLRRDVYQYRWTVGPGELSARDSLTSSGFLRGENVHILPDGKEIFVESSVSVLLDWSGAPAGWLAVMRDVTERKLIEQKLTESEERYRSLVESSPDAIIVSQGGSIMYANPAAVKMAGAENASALVGRQAASFVHRDFRDRSEERFREVEATGQGGATRETSIVRIDGKTVPVESVLIPVSFRGKPAVQMISKDITERKKFQEELLNSERLFRMMFESNPHPMWIYDTDTFRFLFVNDAAISHYGYSREEFLAMTLKELRPAEDIAVLIDNVARIAVGSHDSGTWRHKKKDGAVIDVEIISHHLEVDGRDARVVLVNDITARKKAEDALRESEERQRAVFDHAPFAIFVKDLQGRFILFNRQAEVWSGRRQEDVIGKTDYELFPREVADALMANDRAVIETGKPREAEEVIAHDGGQRTHLSIKFPLFDQDQKVYAICGIATDITERKRAEQAIKEARDAAVRERRRLEIIMNTIPSGVFVAEGPDARVTIQNEQALNIMGRSIEQTAEPSDRIRTYRIRRMDGSLMEPSELPYLRALAGEDVRNVEMIMQRADGKEITILGNAAPLRDENGTIVASVAAFSDITERKKAEDALKRLSVELEQRVRERTAELAATIEALQSEIAERKRTAAERDKLVAAVESTAEAILVTDKWGVIQYVNPAFERITGYSRDEALGKDVHIFDSGQHDAIFFQQMRDTIQTQGVWKGRMVNKKKDGSIYYEDCTYSPVMDKSGAVVNYVSIKHDVTDKLRLEAIAEAVEAMNNIGYVFSGIRHEIGNPVSSLLIIMNLLKKRYEAGPKESILEYIDQAISQLERIEYLLKSLKNFNMYENLQIRSITVASFLEKFLPLVNSDLQKKGIHFQVEAAAGGCMSVDTRALQQALLNVLVNASDAVADRPDPKIVMSASPNGGMINIRVSDNGRGIPEERKKDLFKPFYTTKEHGTGLGLVITRKLISRMNGFIEIASRKDAGTTVDIYLPEGVLERTV